MDEHDLNPESLVVQVPTDDCRCRECKRYSQHTFFIMGPIGHDNEFIKVLSKPLRVFRSRQTEDYDREIIDPGQPPIKIYRVGRSMTPDYVRSFIDKMGLRDYPQVFALKP